MAAIRYKIEDIIFLFMKKPPDKINYNTQKEKLPSGALEAALREKGIRYE